LIDDEQLPNRCFPGEITQLGLKNWFRLLMGMLYAHKDSFSMNSMALVVYKVLAGKAVRR
jgi:hypothetical protein